MDPLEAYESQIAEMDEDSSGKRRTTKSRKWTAKTTRSEPLLGASIIGLKDVESREPRPGHAQWCLRVSAIVCPERLGDVWDSGGEALTSQVPVIQ